MKLPQAACKPLLLAQHWLFWHWLGVTNGLQSAPRGREPAGAEMVGEGAPEKPAVGVPVTLADATADELAMKPLQSP